MSFVIISSPNPYVFLPLSTMLLFVSIYLISSKMMHKNKILKQVNLYFLNLNAPTLQHTYSGIKNHYH